MNTLRKLTTIAAIAGAATFSATYLMGCDEGYEVDGLEGVDGVGESVGEGMEDAGQNLEDTAEDLEDTAQDLNRDLDQDLNNQPGNAVP